MAAIEDQATDITLRWTSAESPADSGAAALSLLAVKVESTSPSGVLLASTVVSVVQAHWIGGSGNWSDAANWDIGIAPNNTDLTQYDVVLDVAGDETITLDQDVTLKSLNNAETIFIVGVRATVSQQTTNSGAIQLGGDTAQLSLSGTVDVTGSLDAGNGTLDLSNSTVTADGAAAFIGADHIVTLSNASLYAKNGGVMSLLGATAYASAGGGNTIQASGAGSRIDLSSLASLAGGSSGNTQIKALSGGALALSGAVTGYTSWTLDATEGEMDVSGVTSLAGATVNVSGGEELYFSSLAALVDVNLTASGASQILFPAATSYTGYNYADNTIQASGEGSRIDLSHLATFVGGGHNPSYPYEDHTTFVKVLTGGEVDLAGAISGRNNWSVDATTGSTLGVAGITKLGGTTLNASQSLEFTLATEVTDSSLTPQAGVTLLFPTVTKLADVNLTASGASQILFPAATSYTGYNYADNTIQASGEGSRIDLSHLATFVGGGHNPSYPYEDHTTFVKVLTGGEVDLAGAISGRNNFTLDGTTSILNLIQVTSISGTALTATNNATWTFPPTWHPTWLNDNTLTTDDTSQFINTGTLAISGNTLTVNTSAFINEGILSPLSGGVLDFNYGLQVNGAGILTGASGGSFNIAGNLLGDTRNADLYVPQATVRFDGAGTVVSPQQFEVMGRDMGAVAAGFGDNFVYANITLGGNTYVTLVDLSDNAAGSEPEALYTNALVIPAGSALNLNGLHLYTRAAVIEGVVVNGSIDLIPDSGALEFASPTPGKVAVAGEVDEWTFFARAGQHISAVVDSGSGAVLTPKLSWAQIDVLDAEGNTLATRSSTASGQTLSLDDVTIPADGNYRIRVKAPAGHLTATGNYQVSVWNVTADVSDLLLNKQVVGQIENPYAVDRWNFSANAGTQIRFDLVNRASSGIVFDLVGPTGWSAFTNQSADSDLITLPTDGNYTLTSHSTSGQQGGAYAFKLDQTQVIDLALNSYQTGHLAGSGQAMLYRIEMPTANVLKVVLDDDASNNVNELYLKYGSAPTRADYDYRFTNTAASDQEILLPLGYAGDWYALVYADVVRTPSDFDISAVASGVFLDGVTPDRYAAGTTATLTLTGVGFDANTNVALVSADTTVVMPTTLSLLSPTRLTVDFSLAGLVQGMYSLVAFEPDGSSDMLANAFTVTGEGEGQLDIQLVLPSALGRHATATLYVDYANTGNTAVSAPILVLQSGDDDNSDRPLLTLDASRLVAGFWTSAIPAGFSNTVQFLASGATPGIIQPGETGRIPVYYAGLQQPWNFGDSRIEFNVGVVSGSTAGGTGMVDWYQMLHDMQPDYVQADAWQAIMLNLDDQLGANGAGYVAALDENAIYLDSLGAGTSDITRLWGFELRQADALNPIRYLASGTAAAVSAPGLDLVFTQAFAQPISRRFEVGPLGRGWAHNWQINLVEQSDGTVEITDMTGTPRIFQPDSRTNWAVSTGAEAVVSALDAATELELGIRYHAAPTDHGTLTALWGNRFKLTETDGTAYVFRSDGKLDYVEDTNGNRITCTYAGGTILGGGLIGVTLDQLTRLTHSSGQYLDIAYNDGGRIASVTDNDGRQTLYSYDDSYEHLIAVQTYDGRITHYAYLPGESDQDPRQRHALSEITFSDGSHRYYTYDTQGRLASTSRDGDEETLTFAYDTTGNVTVRDAFGNAYRYSFDDWGAILRTVNPLGNSVLLTLDGDRNVESVTDPAGETSLFRYDDNGNLTRFTDAMGHVTHFGYTSGYNRLASLTDANGNLTRYQYDSDGNLTAIVYADGSREGWTYDNEGQATQWTNRRGTPVGYTYDADGQITRKTYSDGTHVDYAYDTRGNLTSTVDATGTTTYTYDTDDYLVRIDYPGPGGRWLQFTYDVAGRRASSTDQLGHVLRYQYDAIGRLDIISDETGLHVVDYDYDAAGHLQRKTLGNGVYTTYTYDVASQLLSLVNCRSDGTVLSRFDYTYDSRGRRISMGTLDGLWTYQYDDIGQLTHAVFASTNPEIADQDLLYVYDAMGNRIRTVENGVTTEYTTNNLNQYTQVGDTTYEFDADGNLISEISPDGTTLFSYDSENRLIVVQSGDDGWTYTYDALSQRVASSRNGYVTYYTFDPVGLGNLVSENDAAGSLIARYDYGFGLLSRTEVGSTAWYAFDVIGNTSELTNAEGRLLNSYTYAPYGGVVSQAVAVTNEFQFVGEWGVIAANNGIEHIRARWYSAEIGRFIGRDPIGLFSGDSNFYRYVDNSPAMLIDPTGTKWTCGYMSASSGESLTIGVTLGQTIGISSDIFFTGGSVGVGKSAGLGQIAQVTIPGDEAFPVTASLEFGPGASGGVQYGLGVGIGYGTTEGYFCGWAQDEPTPPKPNPESGPGGSGGTAGGNDPNQLIGPTGFGGNGFLTPNLEMPYRVDFENAATATAPAQQVTITNQLNTNLNWPTFQLTEIGFGDTRIAVPVNSQHYETTVPFNYNGQDFEVQIEAGIQLATGEVYAYFWSVDPLTGLPPDVLTGFLPPEDGTGRGMGYVSYVIEQQPDLPTGTEIRNIALISFDVQPWIATNQVDPHDASKGTDPTKEALNTIDAGTPTSAVLALPASTTDTSFLVQWSGADDAGGSGIGGYDVYVASDGGTYTLWQNNTAETSATFTGEAGHSYAFYSRARDNVGRLEAAPTSADTVISVLATGTVAGTLFDDLAGDGVMNVGDAALSGWTVYLDANGNNTLDVGEVSATTEADGSYAFTGLVAGDYTIAEVLPASWMSVTPASGHAGVTLTVGDAATVDFANFRLGSITGTVFDDDNANQVREADDAGLSGWTVFLDANGNGSLDAGERSTLSSGGTYRFDDLGSGNYRVTLVDQAGWLPSTPGVVSVNMTSGLAAVADYGVASLLQVTGLDPTESGFHVRFSRAFTPGLLNLYDVGGLGTPDISLKDSLGRVVAGSVVLDGDNRGLTFVKSGGVLASGSYTAQLDSRANAFVDSRGWLLDGNADDVAGGNYTMGFSVTTSGAVLAVGDIVRGPGQAMDMPATGAGFPVTLSNAAGATSIAFDLAYDPALMHVANVVLGSGAPAGSHLDANFTTAGVIHVQLTLVSALGAGKVELIRVVANVPATAPYGAKAVLDLRNIFVNGGAMTVRGDDGLHLTAYVGDASGNAKYSTLDLQRLYRALTRQDAGFSAYPLVDPTVVGDVNGSGTLSTLDMQWLYQKLVGTSRPEIPSIPTGIGTLTFSGADPVLSLPTVTGQPGEIVTVPVNLDDATALESVELTLAYAADKLEVVDVRLAALTAGFQWFIKDVNEPGIIRIDASVVNALASGTGKLLEIDFRIKPMAHGTSLLDLRWAALNDTHLTLNPEPRPGRDPTDGLVRIVESFSSVNWSSDISLGISSRPGQDWLSDWLSGVLTKPRKSDWRLTLPGQLVSSRTRIIGQASAR